MNTLGATAVVAALAGLGASAWAQTAAREPQTSMRNVGFRDDEIADMEGGRVVARVVPEKDDNEAFVIAVARIKSRPEMLGDAVRKIETFRSGGRVLQIGRFAAPPRSEDLRALAFDSQDLDDFSRCRVGSCEIQAPAQAMELAHQVNWKSPDANMRATELMKEALVGLVQLYLEQGSAGMVVYDNNAIPVSARSELDKILQNSPNLMRDNPDFLHYLIDFPKGTLANAEDFIYWSKEKLVKPVVSVAHVCIQEVTRGPSTEVFIAIKHIYDSHYFLATVEYITVFPDDSDASRFYLLDAVRARIDPPRKLRGLLLGKIKGSMKGALAAEVKAIRQRLESASLDPGGLPSLR
jgi:hypothetical protein